MKKFLLILVALVGLIWKLFSLFLASDSRAQERKETDDKIDTLKSQQARLKALEAEQSSKISEIESERAKKLEEAKNESPTDFFNRTPINNKQ